MHAHTGTASAMVSYMCDPNKSLPDEIERDALAAASAVRSALLSRSARSASACCVYVMSKSSRVEELILL